MIKNTCICIYMNICIIHIVKYIYVYTNIIIIAKKKCCMYTICIVFFKGLKKDINHQRKFTHKAVFIKYMIKLY